MEKGETLMFSRLHLSGNDIVRKAEPSFMDGERGSWITLDYEDIVGPQYPRTSNATSTRLPVQHSRYVCPRCFWVLGDPVAVGDPGSLSRSKGTDRISARTHRAEADARGRERDQLLRARSLLL